MLNKIFLGMSLLGAEWVLYFLLLLSVLSVTLIFERLSFYRKASRGLKEFREQIRTSISKGQFKEATEIAERRSQSQSSGTPDLETEMTLALLSSREPQSELLSELAQDAVIRARLAWDKYLSILATIGSNAPFLGLFGTVLGIIKAFHDLAQQNAAGGGSQVVTSGIAEALVATAIGLLVAIPAVVFFNLFQRRVKSATAEAEALKSFLVGNLLTPGRIAQPESRK